MRLNMITVCYGDRGDMLGLLMDCIAAAEWPQNMAFCLSVVEPHLADAPSQIHKPLVIAENRFNTRHVSMTSEREERAEAWHRGIRENDEWLYFTDVDLLFTPDLFMRIDEIAQQGYPVFSACKYAIRLPEETAGKVSRDNAFGFDLVTGTENKSTPATHGGVGAGFIIRHDLYRKTGGWNSAFAGWGHEDREFAVRIEAAMGGVPITAAPEAIHDTIHVWHPPAARVGHERNLALLKATGQDPKKVIDRLRKERHYDQP